MIKQKHIKSIIESIKKDSISEASFSENKVKKVADLLSSILGKDLGGDFKLLGGSLGYETFKKKGYGEGKGFKYINKSGNMIRFGWLKKSKSQFSINVVDFWDASQGAEWSKPSITIKLEDWMNIVDVVSELKDVLIHGDDSMLTVKESIDESNKMKLFESAPRKMIAYAKSKDVEYEGESEHKLIKKLKDYGVWNADEYKGFKVTKGEVEKNSGEDLFKEAEKKLKTQKYADPDLVFDDIEKLTKVVALGAQNALIVAGMAGIGKCLGGGTPIKTTLDKSAHTIQDIFEIIAKNEDHEFKLYEMYTPQTDIFVLDENGKDVKVNGMIVKKEPTVDLITNIGVLRVAEEHALQGEFSQVFVKQLKKGDKIYNTKEGLVEILNIMKGDNSFVYDLSVDSETHLYQDFYGYVHHNTFHVEKQLNSMLGSPSGPDAKWRYRQGAKLSPMGLYVDLFMNKDDMTIVYDDSDSVWSDKDSINMLKAALDTKKVRQLTWTSPRTQNVEMLSPEEREEYFEKLYTALKEKPEDVGTKIKLPNTFEFTSRIIFISNLAASKFEGGDMGAIASRSLFMNINLTREDVIKRIESILPFVEPDIPMDLKLQVVEQLAQGTNHLTMRAVIAGIAVQSAGFNDWERLAKTYAGS